jgi:outer membrane protein assembly factor BamB/tetratricopeptide (TPR) repeat protein
MRRALEARRLIALVLFAMPAAVPAAGQGNVRAADRRLSASATLPESNEALLLSGRAEDAIRRGEFRLAIELIEKTRELPPGLVPAPASRTYYPVWRQAVRLLAQMPPPGVALYRQLHDAEVEARLARAAESADVAALRELFRVYRISSHWPRVGIELAAQLLDRGVYGEAVEVLREMQAARAEPDPDVDSALLVALARAGAWRSAERVLEQLRRQAGQDAAAPLALRVQQLEAWLESSRAAESRDAAAQAGRFEPRLEVGLEWSVPVDSQRGAEYWDEDASIAAVVDLLRRLPLHRPVLESEVLLVRVRGAVRAFDAATLTPRWTARELSPGGMEAAEPLRFGTPRLDRVRLGAAERLEISRDVELLLHNSLQHAISAAFGMVLTVEGIAPEPSWTGGLPGTFGSVSGRPAANEIVARDVVSGRLLWRTGGDESGPLAGVAFQDAPLAVGTHLLVPMQREEELRLVVLDPSSGRLLREVPIVGPPTRFTPAGGRCLLTADETSVYVCTGNGVVGALRRDDYQWKWATVYPSTLSEHLGRFFWQPETPRSEPPSAAPILTDELLIVAPVDTDEIIALDRFDGREVWRVPRGQHHVLAGAVAAGLVVANGGLTCLDLADGRTVRWESVPLAICGRPALREEQIFVPTFDGIIEIDGRSGRIARDPFFATYATEVGRNRTAGAEAGSYGAIGEEPSSWAGSVSPVAARRQAGAALAANLIVAPEALFSVSPNRVAKFPDVPRARARYARLAAEELGEPHYELGLAWLDALDAAYPAALERLERLVPPEPALRSARDELLARVCTALANAAGSSAERLEWLRRAADLTTRPQERASLHAWIARALEESGDIRSALAQYREMLLTNSDHYLVSFDQGQRQVAGGLVALDRLGQLLPKLPRGQVAGLIAELIRAAEGLNDGAALLARVRELTEETALRARIDAALILKKLPPELAIRCLPAAPNGTQNDEAFGADLQRRLRLARWETHVSLGMLEAARTDREAWERAAARQPPGQPQDEEERTRIEGLELALRKLERAQPEPFAPTLTRQWVLPRVELVLDPRRPSASQSGTVLVRRLEENTIDLVSLAKGTVLRRAEPRFESHPAPEDPAQLLIGRQPQTSAARGPSPSALFSEHCAVVPVPGGLLCLGLGPERYAGRRIWERSIPPWRTPPAEFAQTALAGPSGVFFLPRPDRVALIDWFDGRLRWQRDLPGLRVERLWLAQDRLIIATADHQVLSLDAASGGELRRLPPETSGWRGMEVVGSTLVAWSADLIVGLEAATLSPRWSVKGRTVGAWTAASAAAGTAAPVLLYRDPRSAAWSLLDVRTGEHALEAVLPAVDEVTALVVEKGVCLVAGAASPDSQTGGTKLLAALDQEQGKPLWTTTHETLAGINVTQLAAHPEFIPVVLVRARPDNEAPDAASMELVLVRKRDGTVVDLPQRDIGRFFSSAGPGGAITVLATPTRILVQGFGQLVAFGGPLR